MKDLNKIRDRLIVLICFISFSSTVFAQMPANLQGQAVVTYYSGDNGSVTVDGFVAGIIDIHTPPTPNGQNWAAPIYQPNSWKANRMGQVFGIAIDKRNNIYLTATTSYDYRDFTSDPNYVVGSAGPGGIYKLDGSTGAVSDFITSVPYTTTTITGTSTLPNGNGTNNGPGLGNICYDKTHDKLFVTNFEDGKIYRIDPLTGKIDGIYDPVVAGNYGGTTNPAMVADNGANGFAPLGDRPWGIAYNAKENKIYYGVWVKNSGSGSTRNVIRSVSLDVNGNILSATDALEIVMDAVDIAPVSDIAFSLGNGSTTSDCMAVSTQGMSGDKNNNAHNARTMQYTGVSNSWSLYNVFHLGMNTGKNSAGGVDYGYTGYNNGTNTGCDRRIWMSGDYLTNSSGFGVVYGLQSSPASGNTSTNYTSVGNFVDLNNVGGTQDKTQIGDVEVFRDCNRGCADLTEYIPNNGFEQGALPEIRGQFESHVFDWFTAAGDPDIFDEDFVQCLPSPIPPNFPPCGLSPLDINCIGIPCNHFGYQTHRTGNGKRYGGLYAAVGSKLTTQNGIDGRLLTEAVEVEFNTALTPGNNYTLQFFVNKAEKGEVDLLVSNKAAFRVKMSTQDEYSGGVIAGLLPFTPVPGDLIYEGTVDDETNWKEIRFNFKPSKAYKFIIIESAFNANVIFSNLKCDVGVAPGGSPPANVNCSYSTPYQITVNDIADDNLDSLIDKISSLNIDDFAIQSYMYLDDVSLTDACYTDSIVIADAGPDTYSCQSPITVIGGNPTATGGTAPYTYNWTKLSPSGGPLYLNGPNDANPIAYPPTTTTYRVTVIDANGFSDFDDVTVNILPDLIADAGNDAGLCDSSCYIIGGAPTASGGSGSYTYSWSPSSYLNNTNTANPKACPPIGISVTYTVTVTDNVSGCQATDQITVTRYNGTPTNLVANGNFDNGSTPTERDQIDYAPNWQRATGTPDLFDQQSICGVTCPPFNNVSIPNNYFGNQSHRLNTSEKRYAGIWSFNSQFLDAFTDVQIDLIKQAISTMCDAFPLSSPPCPLYDLFDLIISTGANNAEFFTEGIETQLNIPMIPGNNYKVVLYAALADRGEFSQNYLANGIQYANSGRVVVKFAENFTTNDPYKPVNADTWNTDMVSQANGWKKMEFNFSPSKPYEYIIIEAGTPFQGDEAYIYIDDVEVIALCDQAGSSKSLIATAEDEATMGNVTIFPNPASNEINIKLPQYIDTPIQVALMDISGKVVQKVTFEPSTTVQMSTQNIENGSYFVSIITNGEQTIKRLMIAK